MPPASWLRPLIVSVSYLALFILFGIAAVAFEVAPGVSAWYATAGLNLALIVLFGPVYAGLIFAATLASGLFISDPPIPLIHVLVPTLVVAAAQALAGTWLRNRWLRLFDEDASHALTLQALGPFLLVCALLPFAIAIPAIVSYYLTGMEGYHLDALPSILVGWWLGDVVGLLSVTPVLLLLVGPYVNARVAQANMRANCWREWGTADTADFLAVAGSVAAALTLASPQSNLYFLCFLPLLWIALRHGLARAVAAVFLTNVLAALGIALLRPESPIQHLQLFMVALALTGLLVGSLVTERRWTISRLKAAASSIRSIIDSIPDAQPQSPTEHEPDHDSVAQHLLTLETVQKLLAETTSQLSSLNDEKDRLLAILSHDMRSPLAGIRGLADVLIEESGDRDPLEIEMIQSIRDSAHQSLRLMENLLRWAQLQTGSLAAERARIDIQRMAHTAVALANSTVRQKSIKVSVDICPDLRAIGDREMTGTILRNLLSNAVKFTHAGGSISFRAYRSNGQVCIEVADNGVGMSEEQLEQVFYIGSKQSTPGTQGERGTGLGLILCRDLAREQNGSLTLKSCQGTGTTAMLKLPAERASEQLKKNASSESVPL